MEAAPLPSSIRQNLFNQLTDSRQTRVCLIYLVILRKPTGHFLSKEHTPSSSQYLLTQAVQLTYAVRGYLERILDMVQVKKNVLPKRSSPLVQHLSRTLRCPPKLAAESNEPPYKH